MEDAQRGRVACHDVYSPCYFLKEAVNAILKCLGLDESNSKSKENCSEEEKNNFVHHEQSSQEDQPSSSSDGEAKDPPSTATDPPENDPLIEKDIATRERTPPRPVVSGGSDPQTNSNPSS